MENELSFVFGPMVIHEPVITTWGIMLMFIAISWLSTRRLDMAPGWFQTIVESIVAAIDEAISDVAPEHGR